MPTIQDTIAAILETDTRLTALRAYRDRLRDALAAEARKRWAEDGAVPSWKAPRLGTVTLAGTDSVAAGVTDHQAYAEWAARERTESASLVVTIPATALTGRWVGGAEPPMEQAQAVGELLVIAGKAGADVEWRVHPGVLDGLVKSGRLDLESGQVITEDGDIVPGVTVRPKEPYLSVRLDPEAKRRAMAEAERSEPADQALEAADEMVTHDEAVERAAVSAYDDAEW